MSGTNYGYVRLSTGPEDMSRDAQLGALDPARCGEITGEQDSGRGVWPAIIELVGHPR